MGRVVGRNTKMMGNLRKTFADEYDLAFIMLSEPYYVTVSEALEDMPMGVAVAFASKGSKKFLSDTYWVPATNEVRRELGSNNFRLRGELLEMVSEKANENSLVKIAQFPKTIMEILPALEQAASD